MPKHHPARYSEFGFRIPREYFWVLGWGSEDWHEAKHDLIPWLNYFLGVLRRAYREFEQRVG